MSSSTRTAGTRRAAAQEVEGLTVWMDELEDDFDELQEEGEESDDEDD